jgi:hypothetical protein
LGIVSKKPLSNQQVFCRFLPLLPPSEVLFLVFVEFLLGRFPDSHRTLALYLAFGAINLTRNRARYKQKTQFHEFENVHNARPEKIWHHCDHMAFTLLL